MKNMIYSFLIAVAVLLISMGIAWCINYAPSYGLFNTVMTIILIGLVTAFAVIIWAWLDIRARVKQIGKK